MQPYRQNVRGTVHNFPTSSRYHSRIGPPKDSQMKQINDKLFNWASDIDPRAIEQAERTAAMPFVDHLALMPDAHVGIGSTVGSVIGTQGAIMPAAVGVDIGCGMIAAQIMAKASDLPESLDAMLVDIEAAIPAGVGNGNPAISADAIEWYKIHKGNFKTELDTAQVTKLLNQHGSLGSGNHFVEICLDEKDNVWAVLHSGSRGIGNMLATSHIKTARELMNQQNITLTDKDLAYFEENTDGYNHYIADLMTLQDYALSSRAKMMKEVIGIVRKHLGEYRPLIREINCHHNYTALEWHGDRMIHVTRKGAIDASLGKLGVIPGSMGARTYIVQGLGEPISYHSCSHGAGRRMSRSEAKKKFSKEDLAERMVGKTWLSDKASQLIDEIPDSYKDIDVVMADQTDLVRPIAELHQILNYKGC